MDAEKILDEVGWPHDPVELTATPFEVDNEVIVIGGGGVLGKVMDVQEAQCLVKFPVKKAEWIDKRILIHYTRG